MVIIWSREPDLGMVQTGTYIDYNFTAKIEQTVAPDPTDPAGAPTTVLIDVLDLVYEPVKGYELPDYIEVQSSGKSVRTSGTIRADAVFERLAYTRYGRTQPVDELQDAPKGSIFCEMVPSGTEYVTFKWKVYSVSRPEDISRIYTLLVRVSWDRAKQTIIEYTGNI